MRLLTMTVSVLAAGVLLGAVTPACAQYVYPLQNPSVRATGMGGPSAAVVWSGDLNTWANPALLGYASGLTVRWNRANLSYASPDARFRAGGVEYGWGGMGLYFAEDGIRLDLTLTDSFGNPLGTAEISQRMRRWGGAISVSNLIETVRGDAPSPGILRHADVAVGFSRKRGDYRYPFYFGGTGETAGATDLGLLARVTPLPETPGRRFFLDLTYGYSVLEEPFSQPTNGTLPEHQRHGIGLRIGRPFAVGDTAGPGRSLIRWLTRGAQPILALTVAADFDRFVYEGVFGGLQYRTSSDIGAELELANALALRFGHIREDVQGLDSFCFGGGIGVPIAGVARVQYDYARFPARGYDRSELGSRHAVSVWIDPIAMVRR